MAGRLLLPFLLVLGVVAYLAFGRRPPAPAAPESPSLPPGQVAPEPVAPKARPLAPFRYAPPPPRVPPGPTSLLLPDGSRVPVLNGAYGAPPVRWPDDRPWSPIKRVVIDRDGMAWYEHEDGSFTTTQKIWRPDLGRYDPATHVYNPETAVPLDRAPSPDAGGTRGAPGTGKGRAPGPGNGG